MSTNTEILQRFYDAINRNDIHVAAREFAPDVVRLEPEGFPTAGTYRGVEAVEQHLRVGRGTWAEGSCNTEGFFENGDKVVVYLHAWVRLQGATEWVGGRFADGFVLREGKIVDYRSFGERDDAMKWAGLKS